MLCGFDVPIKGLMILTCYCRADAYADDVIADSGTNASAADIAAAAMGPFVRFVLSHRNLKHCM